MLMWSLLLGGFGLAALCVALLRYWLDQSRPAMPRTRNSVSRIRDRYPEGRAKAVASNLRDPELPPEWARAPGWEPPPEIPDASKFSGTSAKPGKPETLNYADPSLERPTSTRPANASTFGLGCLYMIPASALSVLIIWTVGGSSLGILLGPGVLLGVPFVVALFFRGWRAFSLAILIALGIVFLIIGICGTLIGGKI